METNIKLKSKFSMNDYIETYTGKHFKVLFPELDNIDIVDIAHSLSMQCRFTGHSSRFYSIAEHCIHVSSLCSDENKLWGLIHDASEAYLTDVAAPIKPNLQNYKEIENNLMEVIALKYNLPFPEPKEVKEKDLILLHLESKQLMKSRGANWKVKDQIDMDCLPQVAFKFYSPGQAEKVFIKVFETLVK